MERKVYFEMGYSELEEMFRKQYPDIEYDSFVAIQECGNDSTHEFTVAKPMDKWAKENWLEIIENKSVGCYQNNVILDKLCEDGLLEPGNYLVKVSW